MAYLFQVTIDSTAPHPLADWWAEALGWQREPTDEAFIRRMVDAGHAAESDTMLYDGKLVWTVGAAIRHPTDEAPRVLFQLVPEPKTVKNRVHVDLATRDVEAEIARLVALGATEIDRRDGNGTRWVVMNDPEGNEFCIG
jgi:Glyoxalase-like domain